MIRPHASTRFLVLAGMLVLVPTIGTHIAGQAGGTTQSLVVALRGGTVLTVTNCTIPNGTRSSRTQR